MIKAFLSHSSLDKEFVRAVARNLGRQFCIFDEQAFDTATSFQRSIEEKLKESSVFVLFATPESIKRIWVDFEITEAWYLTLQKKITKSLVFLMDSSIEPSHLPPWLNRAKVMRTNSAATASREIRHHLDEIIRGEQHPFFEGRSVEMDDLQNLLTPIGEDPPHVIGISGLPNIGRKTFISKAVQLSLNFSRTIKISAEEGDTIEALAIKIASLIEPYSTQAGFDEIIKKIKSESQGEHLSRIINDIKIAVSNKEMPILVDEGGMFTSDGDFSEGCRPIITELVDNDEAYMFVVSSRKPPSLFPSLSLRPLGADHVKRLVSKIALDRSLALNTAQIGEIAEYVNGYPPAAYYAIDLVKDYGIEIVLADKNRLVQFRMAVFIKYLKDKSLSPAQKSILLVLARYSPLPLQVIAETLKLDASSIASEVMGLIDHSLIVPNENGMYAIAEPVADSVVSEFRVGEDIDHTLIFNSLKAMLDQTDRELPRLDLNRLLFRAAVRSGVNATTTFHLTNDLITLVTDFYHRREYRKCIEAARVALQEAPNNETSWDYLIRALIQDEQWSIAEAEIVEFEKYGSRRDIDFLRGFLQRKKGNYTGALQFFLSAEKNGRSGFALNREIANCYFLADKIDEAKKYIKEALAKKDNHYVLDLSIQIANRQGDEATAREGLRKLEALDSPAFVKHRLSTIELRFGDPQKALKAAQEAVSLENRPTFSMLAQLVTCQIRNGNYGEAEKILHRIGSSYGNQKSEIRLGLSCRLEIERKQYSKALSTLAAIANSNSPVYMAMRRDAIAGELTVSVMTDAKRIELQRQLDSLDSDLKSFDPTDAWLKFIK
jgi:tetratricopeptide (TPR) repeat protein